MIWVEKWVSNGDMTLKRSNVSRTSNKTHVFNIN